MCGVLRGEWIKDKLVAVECVECKKYPMFNYVKYLDKSYCGDCWMKKAFPKPKEEEIWPASVFEKKTSEQDT